MYSEEWLASREDYDAAVELFTGLLVCDSGVELGRQEGDERSDVGCHDVGCGLWVGRLSIGLWRCL